MRRTLIFIILGYLCIFSTKAQLTYSSEELFEEGIYFLNRNDHKEALYFFKQIADKYNTNSHYNFLTGECYLNLENQEHLAIPYFEIAVKNIVSKKKYNKRDFAETRAPLHALFYLGNAYRSAGRLKDALDIYNKFIESPYYLYNYNETIVDNEIASCERAFHIQSAPVNISVWKLPDSINTTAHEYRPVLSADETKLIFVRKLKFYDAIFYTTLKDDGTWNVPVNITPDIESDGEFVPTALNEKGDILLLIREYNGNADIYVSYFKNGKWSAATEFNSKINSISNEISACYGNDTTELFLVSNRLGGEGKYDIFQSKYDVNKRKWSKPKQIDELNSAFDEHSVAYNKQCQKLFFASKGHNNMGGYDIFSSQRTEVGWEVPKNLGFPVNTTRNDLFYTPLKDCGMGIMNRTDSINISVSDLSIIRIND